MCIQAKIGSRTAPERLQNDGRGAIYAIEGLAHPFCPETPGREQAVTWDSSTKCRCWCCGFPPTE